MQRPVPTVTSAWARIWRPLREAMPDGCYFGGRTLARVEQRADHVTAIFADGARAEGDLLVAADGLHSSVRGQLLPECRPQYAGYLAWRGVVDEDQVPSEARDLILHCMAFGFPEGELMLSIPMPGPPAGPRRCHFVWVRPVPESELTALCTDASGRRHGFSIPPPLIRPELISGIRQEAEALLAPQLSALVRGTARINLQPIFDLESPAIVFGRVALLGDAAFVARPHVATGVMKAALDAQCLADALTAAGSQVEAGLARYQSERRPYGASLVARGRHIGSYFEAHGGNTAARIETLMREYGAAGLVHDRPITAYVPP
jgi:2-polyprenyl-6-methoxyphenol hydroxylase-like FAD-dependent oxidoreductase